MTAHVTLTEGERNDVLAFWRDYAKSGGEGDAPSAFQLDALNDEIVRDTFLFWHIGGDPFSDPTAGWGNRPGFKEAMGVLGPFPTNANNVVVAMTKAVKEVNSLAPDIDQVDTSTVLVLSSVMFALLYKRFEQAQALMAQIIEVNLRAAAREDTEDHEAQILHGGPLEAMGLAVSILGAESRKPGREEFVDKMLMDLFCLPVLPVLADSEK